MSVTGGRGHVRKGESPQDGPRCGSIQVEAGKREQLVRPLRKGTRRRGPPRKRRKSKVEFKEGGSLRKGLDR